MKSCVLILLFFYFSNCFSQKIQVTGAVGLNYRFYPLDVEDVGYDNVTGHGLPHNDLYFWKGLSLFGEGGLLFKNRWQISVSGFLRYNHMNWEQGNNYYNPSPGKKKERKNLKGDLFLAGERQFPVSKTKKRFVTTGAGLGITNINTRFDVTLQDTTDTGSVTSPKRYKGNFIHFGPRIDLGYRAGNIKFALNIFIIEGPGLNNLTSLWPGLSVSYIFKRKEN